MKIQVDRGNGNKQVSADDTTVQIQIGNGAAIAITVFALVVIALIAYMIYRIW